MPEIYRGVNGVNKLITQQFRGVSGVNREIKEQYRGVNNVNRLVFKRSYTIQDINKMTFEYCILPYPDDGYTQTEKHYSTTISNETEFYRIYARCGNAHQGVQLNGNYYITFNDGIKIPFIKSSIQESFSYILNDVSIKFLCYGIARIRRKDENKGYSGQCIITMFGEIYTGNFISAGASGCDKVKTFQILENYPLSNAIELKSRSKIVDGEDNTENTISEIELKVPVFEFSSSISARKILPELVKL